MSAATVRSPNSTHARVLAVVLPFALQRAMSSHTTMAVRLTAAAWVKVAWVAVPIRSLAIGVLAITSRSSFFVAMSAIAAARLSAAPAYISQTAYRTGGGRPAVAAEPGPVSRASAAITSGSPSWPRMARIASSPSCWPGPSWSLASVMC